MICLNMLRVPLPHPVTSQIKMLDMSTRKPVPVLKQPPLPGEASESASSSRRSSVAPPSRPETVKGKDPKYSPVTFEEVAKHSQVNSPKHTVASAKSRGMFFKK